MKQAVTGVDYGINICALFALLFAVALLALPAAVMADGDLISSSPRSEAVEQPLLVAAAGAPQGTVSPNSDKPASPPEEEAVEEGPRIADPLRPWNTLMYHFNDKLYFWALKPVAQVYSHTVPEPFRVSIFNMYDNLKSPIRFVNDVLQMKLDKAGKELVRFVFNSFAGIGGMGDMAKEALGIPRHDEDFGQTLGHYGLGHGFYLVWPVMGPSSLRDSVGRVGDHFTDPLTYILWDEDTIAAAVFVHKEVNGTSLRIGDYESFKEAAIDPYASMRDAYIQHRKKVVAE